jgi:alkaline phosphatase D
MHALARFLRSGYQPTVERWAPRFPPGSGFPQSVASGDPTPYGAILWTRVDPAVEQGLTTSTIEALGERLATAPHGVVLFQVSLSPRFDQVVLAGLTPIWREFDNVVRVDTDGRLLPGRVYYYRFLTRDGHVSRTGRFKTLPAPDALTPIRIGQVTCSDYTNGYFHAYRFLADESLDFIVHLGDYIYESVGDPRYQAPLADRRIELPSGQLQAITLDDYRTLYRRYRADPDLQPLHERHALIAVWDDHEFANDSYGAVAPETRAEPDPVRRLAANQAWFEYIPARVVFDPTQPVEHSIRLYRRFRAGRLVDLFVTDERLYRSALPCGTGVLQRHLSKGCAALWDEGRTMLGVAQREWLLRELCQSDALWKVWANQVQFAPLKLFGRFYSLDQWDGYPAERNQILRTLQQAGVRPLILLTGDLHAFEINLLKRDFEQDSDTMAIGVELMVGAVSASSRLELIERFLKSSPAARALIYAMAREAMPDLKEEEPLSARLTEQLLRENGRWMKCFEGWAYGYAVAEFTPEQLRWTAYMTSHPQQRRAKRQTLWRVQVRRDIPVPTLEPMAPSSRKSKP